MYNAHEATTIDPEREYNEKRRDDDRKTKQKMELLRSKLKTHARKVRSILCNDQRMKSALHSFRMFLRFVRRRLVNN